MTRGEPPAVAAGPTGWSSPWALSALAARRCSRPRRPATPAWCGFTPRWYIRRASFARARSDGHASACNQVLPLSAAENQFPGRGRYRVRARVIDAGAAARGEDPAGWVYGLELSVPGAPLQPVGAAGAGGAGGAGAAHLSAAAAAGGEGRAGEGFLRELLLVPPGGGDGGGEERDNGGAAAGGKSLAIEFIGGASSR